MTDKELMQQALDALNSCCTQQTKIWFDNLLVYDAISTLRERLAQPERQWVGLTKEEATEISLANRPYVIDMVAALEAKLKEKNT